MFVNRSLIFFLFCRKITADFNVAQPAAGVLGTAVDRMSFAHDIVMIPDNPNVHVVDSMDHHVSIFTGP